MTTIATATLPENVQRPQYDRSQLRSRIVHFGFGAFHRAHQALLTDRVLLRQGKSQRYGSQFQMGKNGLEPSPIEDETNVDARRAQMGMMPLADYLCMVRVLSAA